MITPYLQAEWFDDTRYDGTSRELYQLGAEIGINQHFRVEPSIARQLDYLPSSSGLYAFAFIARWFYWETTENEAGDSSRLALARRPSQPPNNMTMPTSAIPRTAVEIPTVH